MLGFRVSRDGDRGLLRQASSIAMIHCESLVSMENNANASTKKWSIPCKETDPVNIKEFSLMLATMRSEKVFDRLYQDKHGQISLSAQYRRAQVKRAGASNLTIREDEARVTLICLLPWNPGPTLVGVSGSANEPLFSFRCQCGDPDCEHFWNVLEAASYELSADNIPSSLEEVFSFLEEFSSKSVTSDARTDPDVSFVVVLKPAKLGDWKEGPIPVALPVIEGMTVPGEKPRKYDSVDHLTLNRLGKDDAAKFALLTNPSFASKATTKGQFLIETQAKEEIFEELLASGRVFLSQLSSKPLMRGEPVVAEPQWLQMEGGGQCLVAAGPDGKRLGNLVQLHSFWEVIPKDRVMRRVVGDPEVIEKLMDKHEVLSTQIDAIRSYIIGNEIRGNVPLPVSPNMVKEIRSAPTPILKARLLTDKTGSRFPSANLSFKYSQIEVNPSLFVGDLATVHSDDDVYLIHKDAAVHASTYQRIASAGLLHVHKLHLADMGLENEQVEYINGGGASIHDLEHFWRSLDDCEAAGMQVVRMDDFGVLDIATTHAYHTISVSSDDAFNIDVGIDLDGKRHSLVDVMAAALADRRFPMEPTRNEIPGLRWTLRLENGSLVRIPLSDLRSLIEPVAEWLGSEGRGVRKNRQLSRIQAAMLANTVAAEAPRELADLLAALKRLATIDQEPLPATSKGFHGELRHYQREGLRWLNALADAGLGGVLGDDMGLGKTLQVIAHILHLRDSCQLKETALVIVPASLTSTWANAFKNFAPSLKIEILHGINRLLVHQRASEADVLITTYGTMVKDIALLEAQHFALVVADESQNVRNPRTQAAKTLRRLRATRYLNVTGTPLENRLLDLWSQMDIVVPGLLGSEKGFARLVANPIQFKRSQTHLQALTRRIAPFLLRRTKDQVANELPAKTISTVDIELNPAQRVLYETLRAAQQAEVKAAIAERGIQNCGIVVLDALLKLRQVCCDPALAPLAAAKKIQSSAKMEALMELVHEALEGGHRILVFSSFTRMLDRIAARLNEEGIAYTMLTGKTYDRGAVVEAFQNGTMPLFLLSLKAGGVGLNLTAADTVIHYDPWWNPKAEEQATDRAHRIGQDKPVNVYRLIAKDTIEERIDILRAKKAALADAILNDEGEVQLSWTVEDIDHLFST